MHPAQHHVTASKKRQQDRIEGRARGGAVDRPGRGLTGGASEDTEGQSTAKPLEERQRLGIPVISVPSRAKGGGIHIKESHRGELHRELGVPSGEKIPVRKMEAAKESAGPAERKRITFAENARKWGK